MTQLAEKETPWMTALEERPTTGPRWLQELRDQGAERFARLGFPTVRNEEWRFTSVSQIAGAELSIPPASLPLDEARLETFLYADAPHRLVFLNGRFAPALSRTAGLPAAVRFGSLAHVSGTDAEIDVERLLGSQVDLDARAFAALNTAFAADGGVSVPTASCSRRRCSSSSSPWRRRRPPPVRPHRRGGAPAALIVAGEHS
jgi:Fe-S cluster assembly protein SufD